MPIDRPPETDNGPPSTQWGDNTAGQANLSSISKPVNTIWGGEETSIVFFEDGTAVGIGSDDYGQVSGLQAIMSLAPFKMVCANEYNGQALLPVFT